MESFLSVQISKMGKKLPDGGLLFYFVLLVAPHIPQPSDGVVFNRNHTGVYFSPVDFLEYNGLLHLPLNETGLDVLLKKISSRFGHIMVGFNFPPKYGENFLLPEVVAKHNLHLGATSPSFLKLTILYKVQDWGNNDQLHSAFAQAQKLITVANRSSPGTIASVVLDMTGAKDEAYEHYLRFQEHFIDFDQFGIQLDIKHCSGASPTSASSSKFSKNLINDILMDPNLTVTYFSQNPNDPIPGNSVGEAVEIFKTHFRNCQALVKTLNNSMGLGLTVSWPDTGVNGRRGPGVKYSELAHFWREMNDWAGENVSVILLQAFDTPFAPDQGMKTNGWWRLLPNSSYAHPAQFIFEEKESLQDISRVNDPKLVNLTWLRQPSLFNRDQLGTAFLPISLGRGRVPSELGLFPQVSKISTKFSKLFVDTGHDDHRDKDLFLDNPVGNDDHILTLPRSVAMWNSMGNLSQPLKLTLTFDNTNAYRVAKISRAANELLPDTVINLLYSMSALDNDESSHLDSFVKMARISRQDPQMSLGVKVEGDVCNELALFSAAMNRLKYYLKNIQITVIYLTASVSRDNAKLGVQRAVPLFTVLFETCKSRVRKYLVGGSSRVEMDVDVAFITEWPIISEEVDLNGLVQFVSFWEQINIWAEGSNTTVFFSTAFDHVPNPGGVSAGTKFGWWGLGENNESVLISSQMLISEVLFEDKKEAALRYATKRKPKNGSVLEGKSFGIAEIVATLASAVLLLALFLIGYLVRRQKSSSLSSADIAQFFNGGESSGSWSQFSKSSTGTARRDNINGPYQRLQFELSKKLFKIDESSILGSGAFGIVCRGTVQVQTPEGGGGKEVAVKMSKVPSSRSTLRGLLFEIKILSFLGRHPHIVELVGAHTAQLRKGRAFVFLELCGLGSLQNYLKKLKPPTRHGSNSEEERIDELAEAEVDELDQSTLQDLARWSGQVANGLEYIASRNVVHLDIAARNILLTHDKLVKITDFGLSRRMYDYQSYVKKEQEPLPWRSMAPESLRKSEFTQKSDVWSFGVLLWEMYSLGDEPYPGLSWDVNFPTMLERGLRLGEPTYNTNSMYSLMLRCWAINPERRPGFSELSRILYQPMGSSIIGAQADDCPATGERMVNNSTCASVHDHVQPNKSEIQRRCSFVEWTWAVASLLLVILIATLILIFSIQNENGKPPEQFQPNTFLSTSTSPIPNLTNREDDDIANSLNNSVPEVPWAPRDNLTLTHGHNETDPEAGDDYTDNATEVLAHHTTVESVETQPSQKEVRDPNLGHQLFLAIDRKNEDAIKLLVELGADVNVKNPDSETPLYRASSGDDKSFSLRIIKYLIENDADPYARAGSDLTFLHNLVTGASEGRQALLAPSQFHNISHFLISKNMSGLFNIPAGETRHTPFNWAVKTVEVEKDTMSLLLRNGVNFHSLNNQGNNILADALWGLRSRTMLSNLVAHGADWRHVNNFKQSLLHFAAEFGNTGGMIYFLEKGLDVDALNVDNDTPLHWLAKYGGDLAMEMARVLLEHGADVTKLNIPGRTPLVEVLGRDDLFPGDKSALVQLLSGDIPSNVTDVVGKQLGQHLFPAIQGQSEPALKYLVEEGADLNVKNSASQTPLTKAGNCEGLQMTFCLTAIKYLISAGADVYKKDGGDRTFLHLLVFREGVQITPSQFHDMAQFLVSKNKADLFHTPGWGSGEVPIQRALFHFEPKLETLDLLQQNGVNFNVTQKDSGDSLFIYALEGRRPTKYLAHLVKLGVDWKQLNNYNRNLIHLAANFLHLDGIRYFSGLGLDINAQDVWGHTPLYQAVAWAWGGGDLLGVVRTLIELGADVTIKTTGDNGQTPLDKALERDGLKDKEEITQLLRDAEKKQ